MTAFGARLLRGWVASALLMVLLLSFQPGAQADEGESDAFDAVAACVEDRQHLLVLALIDESGSLQRTDPDDQRVPALESALTALDGVQSMFGDEVTIEVALTAFATEYTVVRDWDRLTGGGLGELREHVRGFAERNRGLDTDFALAFEGAIESIEARAGEVAEAAGEAPCRAVYMFTDGDYDLEPRSTPETRPYAPDLPLNVPGNDVSVEEAGRAAVCDEGGLVDRLRDASTPLITVAFTPDIPEEDLGFLRSLSLGESHGVTCGSEVGPDVGAYVQADDLSELLAAFDRAAGRMLGGQPLEEAGDLEVCEGEACAEGQLEFELDGSLRRAHLLTSLVAEGVVVELQGPTGPPVRLDATNAEAPDAVSDAALALSPLSETDLVLDLDLPPGSDGWVGTWTATFIDTTGTNAGAVARAQVVLYGGLDPVLQAPDELRLGDTATIEVAAEDTAGAPRTPDELLGDITMEVVVTDPASGDRQRLDVDAPATGGNWTANYIVPSDLGASSLNISATLQVVTTSGLALQPATSTFGVPVLPPVDFPRVEPSDLGLGTMVGAGSLTSTFEVIGGPDSSGCAWFTAGAVTAPRYAEGVAVELTPTATSEADCISVQPDERREVTLSVSAEDVDSGTATFPVQAHLRSDASADVLEVMVPASFEMVRQVDQLRRLGIFLAILLPSLVLPFLLLYATNWWGARFRRPGFSRHAAVPARIRAGVLERQRRDGTWGTFELDADDQVVFADAPTEDVRAFESGSLRFRGRVSKNPFSAPYATVGAEGPVVASHGHKVAKQEAVGRVAFGLPGNWALEVGQMRSAGSDDEQMSVDGTLHVWLEEAPFEPQGPMLVERLRDEVPTAVEGLMSDPGLGRADRDAEQLEQPQATVEPSSDPGSPWPSRSTEAAGTSKAGDWEPPTADLVATPEVRHWRPPTDPTASQPADAGAPQGPTPPSEPAPRRDIGRWEPGGRDESALEDETSQDPVWRPPSV